VCAATFPVIQLRPYQQISVDQIRAAFAAGRKAPLLVSPTGSGKTVCFAHIAQGASAKGNRVVIAVHRQEIIRQIGSALDQFATPHGYIAAGRIAESWHMTQVASVQTLARRISSVQPPELLVIDEAHHSVCSTYRSVIAAWPKTKILGVTATPERLGGQSLGEVFDAMILGPSVADLIGQGFLSRPVYYAPPTADVSKLQIVAGDFKRDQTETLMDTPHITGSAVEHYAKLCPGSRALVFCTSPKHAAHVAEQFTAAGYAAATIDGTMDDETRRSRTAGLADGSLQILVSVDLIGEGYDCPAVEVGIALRPTASLALHLQQIGRILRPFPSKTRALWLDHVGNCLRHGLAEEPREWTLEPRKRRTVRESPIKNRQCPKCYAVHAPAPTCPQCGHEYPVKPRKIDERTGELREITEADILADTKRRLRQEVGMAKEFKALLQIERERGYKRGWAYMQWRFRSRRKTPTASTPTADLEGIWECRNNPLAPVFNSRGAP
jgi:DNA repair protein RadD